MNGDDEFEQRLGEEKKEETREKLIVIVTYKSSTRLKTIIEKYITFGIPYTVLYTNSMNNKGT